MSQKVNQELKNIVEAALLVAGQPLTMKRMLAMFPAESQPTKDEMRAVLEAIAADCDGRGVELRQVGDGWRVQTKEKYAEYVAKLLEERPPRYSRALLETLAIIAYRQPVTRGEIEDIRGVAVSTETIRTLVERGWIKQIGVREVPGRPAIYGTTPAFLEHFSLKSLDDMPPLAELRSIEDIGAELDQRANPSAPAVENDNGGDHAVETTTEESTAEAMADDRIVAHAITEPETAPAMEAQPPASE
jgi:segregation and condensation protein B